MHNNRVNIMYFVFSKTNFKLHHSMSLLDWSLTIEARISYLLILNCIIPTSDVIYLLSFNNRTGSNKSVLGQFFFENK